MSILIQRPSSFAFILLMLIFVSCSKDTYTKEDLWKMARAEDPSVTLILRDFEEQKKLNCDHYMPGCVRVIVAKVKGLELVLVEFENETEARLQAKVINGYYKYNWVFDDVSGEPILERFIEKVYQAQKVPNS